MSFDNSNNRIELTFAPGDFAVCAKLMSVSDPWVTLGVDYEQCLKSI